MTTTVRMMKEFAELLNVRARYKAFYSGRGCGKSLNFALAAIALASQKPLRFLCCREVQKTIRESVKFELERAINWLGLQEQFVVTGTTITSSVGSYFMFDGLQSVRAYKLQSLAEIDIVWIEEAQSVSATSLKHLIPTIRKSGSEIWFAWNPNSPKDPVDEMFRGNASGRGGEIANQPVPDELKPYYDKWAIVRPLKRRDTGDDGTELFPPVLRLEMERDKQRDPDYYRHVWEGEYSHRSDAAVFTNWKTGMLEVPNDATPYYGADWGFSVDPTVLVRCFVFPESRQLYVDAEVGAVGVEVDKTPEFFDKIEELESYWHPRKWPLMADSARPETISYMSHHGYPKIERARKGPGSIEEGIEFLRNYDIVVNPRCKRVVDELTYYSYERDKKTDEVLPKLLDDHNHTIDALRYAAELIRRNVGVSGFPEVVRETRPYPTFDNSKEAMRNPALSPGRPQQPTRGLVW